jgi:hypothetical protein
MFVALARERGLTVVRQKKMTIRVESTATPAIEKAPRGFDNLRQISYIFFMPSPVLPGIPCPGREMTEP